MAFTLRGRIETRLGAAVLPFGVACVLAAVLDRWWPLEVTGVMLAVGVAADIAYDRLFPYQPGWLALPLGILELAATMAAAANLDVDAPPRPAVAFFAFAWLTAQVLVHALLPLRRLTYGDDGGELGRGGPALALLVPVVVAGVLGVAWATLPPLVHLEAGVHQGPLVLDRAQRLVGEEGAVVRGGIVITADDVTVRNVAVEGGEFGIEVDGAEDVLLDRVLVSGAQLDGINVRRSVVTIRDCEIRSLPEAYVQGIDISFGFDLEASVVEGCTITGGLEGIVSHFASVHVRDNRVRGTELRGITVTEMSMGKVEDNHVSDGIGVGIFCGDYSECEIEDNAITGVLADPASSDPARGGVAIAAHFGAKATIEDNEVERTPRAAGAFVGARIERD